jgi:O-antigen/teichoic acid export membrane protein
LLPNEAKTHVRLGRNLIAGILSLAWSALVTLVVVPLYLKYLGLEAYGLVGFFTVTQSLLYLLDFGLAPAVNREVARYSALARMKDAANLLHTLAVVYWAVAALIGLVFASAAGIVARHWLQSSHSPPNVISHALILMGFVIACRWPTGLYQGALMGAERLTTSSAINIAMVTLENGGAVCVLAFVSPTVSAFFLWQAAVGLVHTATMRYAAWRVLGGTAKVRFDLVELKRTWRFSAGVTGIALSSLVLMQMDKVLLSRILTLEDFGRYMLATLMASGLYVILTPVYNAIYPRMSGLISSGNTSQLVELYRSGTRLLVGLIFPIAITGVVFSRDFVDLWTRNPQTASTVAPIVSLFLIGTMLNGAMVFPYALQLAYGATRLPLKINAILLAVFVPLVIFLAERFGAVGGAGAWAILNCLYLFIGTWLTHRSLLKGIGVRWFLYDVARPLGLAVLIAGLGGAIVRNLEQQELIRVFIGTILAFVSFAATVFLSPGLLASLKWREFRSDTVR